jgi:hypothetical protein
MKFRYWLLLVVFVFSILSACNPVQLPPPDFIDEPVVTASPDSGTVYLPAVQQAALDFLTAWQNEDYAQMHSLLTPLSRDGIKVREADRVLSGCRHYHFPYWYRC